MALTRRTLEFLLGAVGDPDARNELKQEIESGANQNLVAGSGISLTPSGNDLTIAATGGGAPSLANDQDFTGRDFADTTDIPILKISTNDKLIISTNGTIDRYSQVGPSSVAAFGFLGDSDLLQVLGDQIAFGGTDVSTDVASPSLVIVSGSNLVASSTSVTGDLTISSGLIDDGSGTTGSISVQSGDNNSTGASGVISLVSGDAGSSSGGAYILTGTADSSGEIQVGTGDSNVTTTGDITIFTGVATTNSGNITLQTGTAGTLKGKITLDGRLVKLPVDSSDPSAPAVGDVYFNSVSQKLKVYTSGGWETVTSA